MLMFNKINHSVILYSRYKFIFFAIFTLFFIVTTKNVQSFDITLAWDANRIEDLAGFKAFYREEDLDYDYNNPAWKGNVTTCTIYELDPNVTTAYYFVVRGYDELGNETNNSNEVRYSTGPNSPPVVDAGTNQTVTLPGNALLDGTVTDDGLPIPPGVVTTTWSKVSGTGTVTFVDANAVDTTSNFSEAGTYVLCLTADDGELIASDDIKITVNPPDIDLPSPDPMTWQILPHTTGASSISMTATTATDRSGVEYYFECIAGGGHDSRWQDSPTYRDIGLQPDTEYTYRIKARDKSPSHNETNWSQQASAITEGNLRPIAVNQYVTTVEDTPKDITPTASDGDSDPLNYIVIDLPSHGMLLTENGMLSGIGPYLTYSPDEDYHGSDSFTFKANDGHEVSNIATVSITITPVNDPPMASSWEEFSTLEDVVVNSILYAFDVDGDALTYSIVTKGAKGNATITNASTGAFTYTPDKDVNGRDSFRYKVNDGTADSEAVTVMIEIIPVNDPPEANSQSLVTDEDTALSILLTGSDFDGDHLSYAIMTQPSHGSLSGTAPNLTYLSDTNYSGPDSFSFKVNDGIADSDTADVSITIYPVDDPTDDDPLADCRIYEDSEDGNTNGWIIYDQDPLGASISNVFDADRQSLVIELTGAFRDYCYLLQGADGSKWNNSSQSIIHWSMKYSNYFVVYIDIHTTAGDKYLFYTPADIDTFGSGFYIHHGLGSKVTDGQWHTFERNLQADLEEAQPGVSILEVNGFMAYGSGRVDDIVLCKNLSTDTNDIPANSLPIASNQSVITDEDTPMNITLTATDADLDPLTYRVVIPPSYGELSGEEPNLSYTPNADYNGTDSFTFRANDGYGDSNTAIVSITIDPVNDPPVAGSQTFSIQEDTAIDSTFTGSDIDGDELIYSIVSNGGKGKASVTDPSTGAFTYNPDKDVNGMDNFYFKVNDGIADSEAVTVTIDIVPVNDPPVANSQSLVTDKDTALSILLTGSDLDGDNLNYTIVTQPSHGSLSGTAPSLTYLSDTNYSGPDSFSFKVNDGSEDSNTASVSIIIFHMIQTVTKSLTLKMDWSMICLPIEFVDPASGNILLKNSKAIYTYEKETGYKRISSAEELEIGKGYWILGDKNQTLTLAGKPVQSYTLTVDEDEWIMIGGCSSSAKALAEGCNIRIIYGYDNSVGYYRIPENQSLEEGKGYWILLDNVTEQCELNLESVVKNQ